MICYGGILIGARFVFFDIIISFTFVFVRNYLNFVVGGWWMCTSVSSVLRGGVGALRRGKIRGYFGDYGTP